MALARPQATSVCPRGAFAKASRAGSLAPSFHNRELQRNTGLSLPARCFPQAHGVHPDQANCSGVLPGRCRLPASAIAAAPGPFIPRASGSRRPRVNTQAQEHAVQGFAQGSHRHPSVLSSSAVSVGIDPNEIGLTHGTQVLSPRGKSHD